MRVVSLLAGVATLALACTHLGHTVPQIQPGQLPTRWYAGGRSCADVAPFRVQAYNADFFILRQAACTNYEKPFLYLLFGSDRALLLDTGAGKVDLVTPIDS